MSASASLKFIKLDPSNIGISDRIKFGRFTTTSIRGGSFFKARETSARHRRQFCGGSGLLSRADSIRSMTSGVS